MDDGRLEIIDPTFSDVPLLREINPDFKIETAPLLNFSFPRFQRSRQLGCGFSQEELRCKGDDWLWALHDQICCDGPTGLRKNGEVSLLDLKIELARRQLMNCNLCAHRCGVNRLKGKTGVCGLGPEAHVGDCFPHIGEEAPINPSYLISLYGCGLRCQHCQQSQLLDISSLIGDPLMSISWEDVMGCPVRSISFAGGNPDENLYGILQFMNSAPESFMLPIVWNCHGYSTSNTIKLLDGVVDVYVPDFKYWKNDCAQKLSSAPCYGKIALSTIKQMLTQSVPVIVRILVLPGHADCCHLPTIDALRKIMDDNLLISIRNQYSPGSLGLWVGSNNSLLAARPMEKDIKAVKDSLLDLNYI